MPSSHIWLVNVWHLVSCLIGGVNRHIGWYIGSVSGECRLTYQLIYRPSIGGYIDQVSVECWSTVDQVSVDVSVNRWSIVSHDSVGSMCQSTVSRVSAMYMYWWCIGLISIGTACSTFLLTSSVVLFIPHHTSPTSGIANNTTVLMSQKDPNYLTDMSYLEMGKLSNLQTNKLSLNLKKAKLWSCAAKKLFYNSFVG